MGRAVVASSEGAEHPRGIRETVKRILRLRFTDRVPPSPRRMSQLYGEIKGAAGCYGFRCASRPRPKPSGDCDSPPILLPISHLRHGTQPMQDVGQSDSSRGQGSWNMTRHIRQALTAGRQFKGDLGPKAGYQARSGKADYVKLVAVRRGFQAVAQHRGRVGTDLGRVREATASPARQAASSEPGVGRAGRFGGAREGRPSEFRMARAASGSWMAARMRIRPPQWAHFRTSTAKTRLISAAQGSRRGFPGGPMRGGRSGSVGGVGIGASAGAPHGDDGVACGGFEELRVSCTSASRRAPRTRGTISARHPADGASRPW
jgi:hypothetical protein